MIKKGHTGYLKWLACDRCPTVGECIDVFEDDGPIVMSWGLDNGWQVGALKDDLCPKCLANSKGT